MVSYDETERSEEREYSTIQRSEALLTEFPPPAPPKMGGEREVPPPFWGRLGGGKTVFERVEQCHFSSFSATVAGPNLNSWWVSAKTNRTEPVPSVRVRTSSSCSALFGRVVHPVDRKRVEVVPQAAVPVHHGEGVPAAPAVTEPVKQRIFSLRTGKISRTRSISASVFR